MVKSKYALEYAGYSYDDMADGIVLYYPYGNDLYKVPWYELARKLDYTEKELALLQWNFTYDRKLDNLAYKHGEMKLSDNKTFFYDYNGVVHVDLNSKKKQPYIMYHSKTENRKRGYVAVCGRRMQDYLRELIKRDRNLKKLYGDVMQSGTAQVHHSLPWFSQDLEGNRVGWFKVLPSNEHAKLTKLLQRLENDIRDWIDKAPYLQDL